MSIADPTLWAVTIAGLVALFGLDLAITRRPHVVGTGEAVRWSLFYIALPLVFGAVVWWRFGAGPGGEFLTGYLVEKSLSVDNLFVFMVLMGSFAVPKELQQRVLLLGIAGALMLRGVLIALGAAALSAAEVTFLLFGLILVATAVKVLREARAGHSADPGEPATVRLLRRVMPVTDDYRGTRMLVREGGRRALTPLAVVVAAVFGADVVFAVDSVPAVYGVTDDPYLVLTVNAFALLGLRALYFLLADLLARLVHLGYGLAAVLALIGAKLVLHWGHLQDPRVPEIETSWSSLAILAILAVVTVTSLLATRAAGRDGGEPGDGGTVEPVGAGTEPVGAGTDPVGTGAEPGSGTPAPGRPVVGTDG